MPREEGRPLSLPWDADMKGFYILAAIALAVAALLYLALEETNSDLERRFEFLEKSVTATEDRLKEAMDPLKRLRAEKMTIRLDKEYSNLRHRTSLMRRKLNALRHGIETLTPNTRKATEDSLAKMRQDVDILLLEIDRFLSRVKVIDRFTADRKGLEPRIRRLLKAVAERAKALEAAGTPPAGALRDRMEKVTESARRALKEANEALNWIWQDLNRGETFADRAVNDLKKCIPALEALCNDLEGK